MKTNYEAHREDLLKDPELLKEYEIEKKRLALVHKILQIRKDLNITQKEMAEKLHTSQSVIARIENGKQNITFDMMCKISSALGKNLVIELR